MKPFYQDNHDTLYCLDFRENELPDECVQMVCTSPPYWGLRKYSGEQELIWSGENDCEHKWDSYDAELLHENRQGLGSQDVTPKLGIHGKKVGQASFCALCGAWKGAYGLEPTPEMYIEHTIEILREIRRVLRPDGVVFWNIGDSYQGGNRGASAESDIKRGDQGGSFQPHNIGAKGIVSPSRLSHATIKPKDLCLIPFRVAIAAQTDGWWVVSDIIWSKPNPMPESVTKRPTRSHEYILMLTKNAGKSLYWTHRDSGGTRSKPKADYRWVNQIDHREVAIEPSDWKTKIPCPQCGATGKVSVYLGLDVWQDKQCDMCQGKKETQLWKRINLWRGHDYYWDADAVREAWKPNESDIARALDGSYRYQGKHKDGYDQASSRADHLNAYATGQPIGDPTKGRNIRSVWEFPTQPYPEAHFAVFPEKLPEICIKAATPEVGCCSKCGAPWTRVLSKGFTSHDGESKTAYTNEEGHNANQLSKLRQAARASGGEYQNTKETLGWQPTCKCNDGKVPSTVLDCFAGAGTTLWVAKKLNRYAVGYELSQEYCHLAVDRCRQQVLM